LQPHWNQAPFTIREGAFGLGWSVMTFLRIVIPLLTFCLSMISAQTRSVFVAKENRYPLFRIML
jgi:hypothetical protein